MMWLPVDPLAEYLDEDEYEVLLCVQIRDWLYTLVACPQGPVRRDLKIETRPEGGEKLFERASTGYGSDSLDLAMSRCVAPPEDTAELTVTIIEAAEVKAQSKLRATQPSSVD